MSGIYGNNNEDKYFENKLLNHLEGSEYAINTNIEFDDYQFEFNGAEYSVSGTVDIVDNNIAHIEYFRVEVMGTEDWEVVTENAQSKVLEFLDCNEKFMEYLFEQGDL